MKNVNATKLTKTLEALLLTTLFVPTAHANETVRSDTARSEVARPSGADKQPSPTFRDKCPPLLESWVDDDFKDKSSWGLSYKSEAKMCQSQVETYKDFITRKKQSPSFADSKKLGDYFSEKFGKQINPSYGGVLSKCNSLPAEKSSAVQTRFYSAGTKLEAVNSSIVDELAYLDSVLPESKGILNDVECAPVWPEIKGKCEISKAAGAACSSSKQTRFDDLIKKTQETLPIIEGLIVAQQSCLNKFYQEPGARVGRGFSKATQEKIKASCDPIGAAIELKKNEIPWVRGEDFQKLAVKAKARPRNAVFTTEYDLSNDTISKAISSQLNHNRATLAKAYKGNLEDFRCLSNGSATGQTCDFNKIRTRLQKLPDLRTAVFSTKNSSDKEANTYFDAERCLLERGEDREQAKTVVDSAMGGIALTVATFGVGEVIAGIRVLNATSNMARVKQGLIIGNAGANMTIGGVAIKHAFDVCSEETKSVINLSQKTDAAKENVCSGTQSGVSQAKEKESNCMVTALLTAPSVLPFVGAIPTLRALSKGGVANDIKAASASTQEGAAAITWDVAKGRLSVYAADLESGSPERMSSAIKKLGETKIDVNSFAGQKPAVYNGILGDTVDKLKGVINSTSTDPAMKLEAMKALAKFSDANTNGYKNGFLVRAASENIDDIYRDYRNSDEVRKLAYDELQKVNKAMKGSMYDGIYGDPFKTSAELRKQDTVGFLGKTKQELSYKEQSAASTVENNFGTVSDSAKKEIYQGLVQNGQIPAKYQSQYIEKLELKNNNYLGSLERLGFDRIRESGTDRIIYANPKTGATIYVADNYRAGDILPEFSTKEVAAMKEAIANGTIYQTEGYKKLVGVVQTKDAGTKSSPALDQAKDLSARPLATDQAIIRHQDFGGMKVSSGSVPNVVGQKVEIPFTPTNGETGIVKGTVIREYQAGMDVLTAEGKVVKVNANFGEIGTGRVTKSDLKFDELRGQKAVEVLKGDVPANTFVIATLPKKGGSDLDEMAQVSGYLTKEKIGRNDVAVITDLSGQKHYVVPDQLGRAQNFIEVQVANAKPAQVKDLKLTPETQINSYPIKESGAAKRTRLAEEKKQAVVEEKQNQTTYSQFEQLSGQPGTSLQSRMGYLTLPGDPVPPQGPILLLSPERLKALPEGTPVWGMDGKRKIKGIDKLDDDTRGGVTWWGLRPKPTK